MARTRYYTVDKNGRINGGGTDNRQKAEQWLDENDAVHDLIAAEGRDEARRKYVD